VITSAGTT